MAAHLLQLAEQVVTSGKNVNIAESIEVMKGSGANVKSLLAIPVRNPACQIIGKKSYTTVYHDSRSSSSFEGVAKIINKLNNEPFDDNDEQLFEVGKPKRFVRESLTAAIRRSTICSLFLTIACCRVICNTRCGSSRSQFMHHSRKGKSSESRRRGANRRQRLSIDQS